MQDIPVDLLVGHSENSNFMGAEMLKKLRRHIERTGMYEPLAVRPHAKEEGLFEVSVATTGSEIYVPSGTRQPTV